MIFGLLLLLLPVLVFLVSIPFSKHALKQCRTLYLSVGALIVFAGSCFSLYLAAYTGDQGGIGAFFSQLLVVTSYLLWLIACFIFNKRRAKYL
jgi:hypothetical protein